MPHHSHFTTDAFSPMTKQIETKVASDGLRYTAKAGGSPYLGGGTTMSCFRCGRHRIPTQLQGQHLLGRSRRVCKPSCAALAAPAQTAMATTAVAAPAGVSAATPAVATVAAIT